MYRRSGGLGSLLGQMLALVALIASGFGAFYFLSRADQPGPPPAPQLAPVAGGVKLGVAYGTEKEAWLRWAAAEFAKTPGGAGVSIDLQPRGSLDAAQALLSGDRSFQVWAPADSLYIPVLESAWQAKFGRSPFTRVEHLAMTPMVFVMWEERYQAFLRHFPRVSFTTIGEALAADNWAALGGRSEWGLFKFAHIHPLTDNSGLATVVLMANDVAGTHHALKTADLGNAHFQAWLRNFEGKAHAVSNGAGRLIKDLVDQGPSGYDGVFAYESVVVQELKSAETKFGRLRVVYPEFNLWNDNPYCMVAADWVSDGQKQAAQAFLDFLLSEPAQRQALACGLRPVSDKVPAGGPGSPLVQRRDMGLSLEVGNLCEAPGGEVVSALLDLWRGLDGQR
jgi:Ca-activated chloride channel family protein